MTPTELRAQRGQVHMMARQATIAAEAINKRFPHLIASAYESPLEAGSWAVEVKQRAPWSCELWTPEEYKSFMTRWPDDPH